MNTPARFEISSVMSNSELDKFYDSRFAAGYMRDYWDSNAIGRLREVLLALPRPDAGMALDFGCGQGTLTAVLRDTIKQCEIFGVDLSEVAIKQAREQNKDITFLTFDELKARGVQFDFIMTHHVLEHVEDLNCVLNQIHALLKPNGAVLHVLPCGNEGSFEHHLASIIENGVDSERGNRFYFEEPGHLRRLTTRDLESLYAGRGMVLAKEYYHNHWTAGIENFTKSWRFFLSLTNPAQARHQSGRQVLKRLRRRYLPSAVIRVTAHKFQRISRKPTKSVRDWLLLAAGAPVYPLAHLIDKAWRRQAWREWETRKHERSGGGMYLYFSRSQNTDVADQHNFTA